MPFMEKFHLQICWDFSLNSYCSDKEPIEIIGKNKVEGVKFVKTELKKTDIRGREIPVPIKGSEKIIKADRVIMAFGFRPNPPSWLTKNGVKIDDIGRVIINI